MNLSKSDLNIIASQVARRMKFSSGRSFNRYSSGLNRYLYNSGTYGNRYMSSRNTSASAIAHRLAIHPTFIRSIASAVSGRLASGINKNAISASSHVLMNSGFTYKLTSQIHRRLASAVSQKLVQSDHNDELIGKLASAVAHQIFGNKNATGGGQELPSHQESV